jgi:hypothetical protein
MTPFTIVEGGEIASPWLLVFEAEDGSSDWGYPEDAESLHDLYQVAGSPYTVTLYDRAKPEPDTTMDLPLSIEQRNPGMHQLGD